MKRSQAAGGVLLITGIIVLAFNLRSMITGVPPVFPELQSVLHVSSGSLAVLAAVPVLCFGVFSGGGAPLSRRFGEERVLAAALLLIAGGLVLRAAAPSALLFPGTIVAGAGIALMNVLLPSLVKRRAPDRAGLLIGLYLLALAGGSIVAAALAVPVFNAAGGGLAAARLILGLWAGPALIAVLIWAPQLRFRTRPEGGASAGALTLRRSALAWQVTLYMGLQSLSYYAALSWFATMFRDRGASAAYAGTLLALMNVGNAITAMAVPVLAHRYPDQRMLATISVLVTAAGLAGAGFGPYGLAPAFIVLLGLGQGASLGLGIYYTMARAPDPGTAASLSAFAQGIGYLIASLGPLAIGFLHTATGGWSVPVAVLLAICVLQLVTGWLAGRPMTVPSGRLLSPVAQGG
jgi:CP family cyanate transporter-like MFS transporter